MALIPSKHRVTDDDELTSELWNALVEEYGLALVGLLEKARTFDAAEAALIATALHRLDQALAPALAAAAEAAANFDPLNYYEKEEIDAAIAAVVGDAPSTLNTLAKLAAAIGDTEDFAESISAALSGKAASVHGHVINDVTGLSAALNGKAASTHGHDMTAIEGLTAALAAKAVAGLIGSAGLTMATAKLLGRTTASTGAVEEIAAGTGISLSSTTLAIDKASDANVRSGASNKVVTTDLIESACATVTLTDGANIALDWDSGINFQVTLGGNRTLSNPTNVQIGTTRTLMAKASSGTRALAFGSNYKSPPTLSDIASGKWYLLTLFAHTSTHIAITAMEQVP